MNADKIEEIKKSEAVLDVIQQQEKKPSVVYRQAGDVYLLVEYGDVKLDLNYRFQLHELEKKVNKLQNIGILETVPGVRSLLIHYDITMITPENLVKKLKEIEGNLPDIEEIEISSRIVHLPVAFHEKWTRKAQARYMKSIRNEGPYLPDNMKFVAKCNGLEGVDEVVDYITSTRHMIIGLGDVYLGAPCLVPLDPRYRLIAPKYNPARTWTPEGAVGIGGSFMCIYGMESPGGYQLIGRTIPIWNTWQNAAGFERAPWLFKFFDRVQYHRVSEKELIEKRKLMDKNKFSPYIEDSIFKVKEYNDFVDSVQKEAKKFKEIQQREVARHSKGY